MWFNEVFDQVPFDEVNPFLIQSLLQYSLQLAPHNVVNSNGIYIVLPVFYM